VSFRTDSAATSGRPIRFTHGKVREKSQIKINPYFSPDERRLTIAEQRPPRICGDKSLSDCVIRNMKPDFGDITRFGTLIAEQFAPDKIILFGSYAYGEPTKDSDVDLLIIMPHEGRASEKAIQIRSAFPREFPLDLIVRSAEELRTRLGMDDHFIREITERGKVIYERGN
jgi:predicted nucleotidyltransferase